jgi:hypothetical protein
MHRVMLAASVAALLLAGVLPATASAAPVLTFGQFEDSGLMLRSNCIYGRGPVDSPVHVVWRGATGTIKAIVDVQTNLGGGWSYCSATRRLAVGDTIRAKSGTADRTITMPNITLTANRDTNTFRGRGLPGKTATLWYHAGIFADFYEDAEVTADGVGRWSFSDGESVGASGGIEAEIHWTTAKGDTLTARTIVPYVRVTIGRPFVGGGNQALSPAVVNLRDPLTDQLRGRATATSDDWGVFAGRFVDNAGNPVNARVGDRVDSVLADSIDWHVPNIEGSASPATDIVEGRCYSSEITPYFAILEVFRTGQQRGWAYVGLDESGAFEIDFWRRPEFFFDPANIKHGDRIVINCYYDSTMDEVVDDIVSFPFRVP